MSNFLPASMLLWIAMLAIPEVCLGQSIPLSRSSSNQLRTWPAPVRNVTVRNVTVRNAPAQRAQHLEPAEAIPLETLPANALRMSSPSKPHRVIQPPGQHPVGKRAPEHPWFHHPHYWTQHHRPIQPVPARLPEANQRETWKSPYSYGYFGASSARQWSTHSGYRDRYTEWRLH